ncbi:DNA recombination protein RmuC [Elstera cyanobacteriorum]|uniref:DNA recombination protein RmuC n=1 Tax=Elstera cyanobacteriorum TaxID=2022747 RepID=UPI0023537C03|nr:DNA recombination protein RmuC [Elstera cyanobacteriorum]MCK6441534.1 DNA recombination protein RmuC [Elstera cyanobacteriorum]
MDGNGSIIAAALLALFLGVALGWLIARSRQAVLAAQLAERTERLTRLETDLADASTSILDLRAENAELRVLLDTEKHRTEENLALLDDARRALSDQFRALSTEALEKSNASFLQLAEENFGKLHQAAKSDLDQRSQAMAAQLTPVVEHLNKLDINLREIEKTREGAYHGLREQTALMRQLYQELKSETGNLTRALRAPTVRGRWGEIQLKRVVELAGMVDHCDFQEQVQTPEDKRLRPDLVVRLPGGKSVIVDAKAPLEAYLAAVEASDDDTRRAHLAHHARQIRTHIKALSEKTYWEQFKGDTPEFVVLFLPGEHFFAAALEHDPGLIEAGVEQSVILATPTTLISLLRAVAYGWRQERLAQNAREIAGLGREMHKRLSTFSEHLAKIGKGLETAAGAYNSAVGAFDSRVLVQARKLADFDTAGLGDALEPPPPVETALRRSASVASLPGPGLFSNG